MRHKILFNGLLYAPDGTGISRYAEWLVKEFVAGGYAVDILLRDDYKQQYEQYDHVLFAGRDIHSSGQRIITEQWQLRKLYRQYDLVHFPDYATPVFTKTASVASVHDLSMKTMRQQRTWKQNVVKNTLLQNTVHRSSGVLCSSEFTRQELLNYYPQLESRSQTVHLGVKPSQLQEWSQATLQTWQLVPQQYILYVGTLAPHKNLVPLGNCAGRDIWESWYWPAAKAGCMMTFLLRWPDCNCSSALCLPAMCSRMHWKRYIILPIVLSPHPSMKDLVCRHWRL